MKPSQTAVTIAAVTLPDLLTACAQQTQLRFLLIGGHAVIAHGYPRATFDIDFLVRREQRAEWVGLLAELKYRLEHEAPAFLQFTPSAGESLDVMMVNDSTFDEFWTAAMETTVGGHAVKIPSLDHLIALKLHVLKQNLLHRTIKDLDDVIRLSLANHVDLQSDHYRRLFEKYGTNEDYQRAIRAVSDRTDP